MRVVCRKCCVGVAGCDTLRWQMAFGVVGKRGWALEAAMARPIIQPGPLVTWDCSSGSPHFCSRPSCRATAKLIRPSSILCRLHNTMRA